jgi:hypothetical protein
MQIIGSKPKKTLTSPTIEDFSALANDMGDKHSKLENTLFVVVIVLVVMVAALIIQVAAMVISSFRDSQIIYKEYTKELKYKESVDEQNKLLKDILKNQDLLIYKLGK